MNIKLIKFGTQTFSPLHIIAVHAVEVKVDQPFSMRWKDAYDPDGEDRVVMEREDLSVTLGLETLQKVKIFTLTEPVPGELVRRFLAVAEEWRGTIWKRRSVFDRLKLEVDHLNQHSEVKAARRRLSEHAQTKRDMLEATWLEALKGISSADLQNLRSLALATA